MILDYEEGDYASYIDGAFEAEVRKVSTGRVIRKFSGETAWMNAQRLVTDLAYDPNHWDNSCQTLRRLV